jgi:hypothetical protein
MKLGKHAVKVLAVFAVLFVVGFALKFLNLHEGFVTVGSVSFSADNYGSNERRSFLRNVGKEVKNQGLKKKNHGKIMKAARQEAKAAGLKLTAQQAKKKKGFLATLFGGSN